MRYESRATDGGPRQGVQAIARATSILRTLEAAPRGRGISEIAGITELPKSTVHRLVTALANEHLVSQSEDGRVRLGGGIVRLAAASREALGEQLRPVLFDLRRRLDETVDLSVLDGAAVRFVEQVPAPHRLRAVSSVGEAFPLHCTANGKALLAAMPEQRLLALLPAQLERLTPSTIVDREQLLVEIQAVRRSGVAFDREEHTEGICAIGVAVPDETGVAAAAISVPVPSQRFSGREKELATAVRAAGATARELFDRQ
ncbi:MAG TPA: IclR family transcriptional regulator [Solirubrobacterales bacterium]|nr:IclR family transcriptional regulator [Solirubrobacterales bacterium]